MATINDLRLKSEWERLAASPTRFIPKNQILWQAVKREWRARLQDGQGQDRD